MSVGSVGGNVHHKLYTARNYCRVINLNWSWL
jgi:hypothetical protein